MEKQKLFFSMTDNMKRQQMHLTCCEINLYLKTNSLVRITDISDAENIGFLSNC